MRGLSLLALLAAVSVAILPARAADIQQCSMVASGKAKVLSYEARTAGGQKIVVDGILTRPAGDGPFPLVVMLPGDGGLATPYCNRFWASRFADWGYASLIVAVTTARDESGKRHVEYSFLDVVEYARFVAAALLESPEIDSRRIGLWGFSRGGLSALEVAADTEFRGGAFKTVAALAPHCPARSEPPRVPTLVIAANADGLISANVCVQYAKRMQDSSMFEFVLLDGAKHVFWLEEPFATTSTLKMKSFLMRHL